MVEEIKINSPEYHNVKFSAVQILEWLETVRDLSGEEDLSLGLKRCHLRVLDEDQAKALTMVRILIVQEASGNIIPPIKLYETYSNLDTHSLAYIERRKLVDRRKGVDRRTAAV